MLNRFTKLVTINRMIRVIFYAAIFILFVGIYYRYRLYRANVSVSSWLRSPLKNKRVGGSISSLHLIGWAYDVVPATKDNMRKLKEIGFRKIIDEKDHIHVQII